MAPLPLWSVLVLVGAAAGVTTPSPGARRKLAVLDVRALGAEKAAADLLSEVAVTEASRFRKLETISESDVIALLGAARQRQILGCKDDAACVAEIGGALGADYMLVGSLGRLGNTFRLDLKLMDGHQARVLARFGETIEGKEEGLIASAQRGVRELLQPVAGEPEATRQAPGIEPSTDQRMGKGKLHRSVSVEPGGEILVDGYKNWRPGCLPAQLPEIRVVRQPQGGTVELRPGSFPIFTGWIPGASGSCDGKRVRGLGVHYRARSGFSGTDNFAYPVTLGRLRPRTFEVEAFVQVGEP
jgi:TolB-like protein